MCGFNSTKCTEVNQLTGQEQIERERQEQAERERQKKADDRNKKRNAQGNAQGNPEGKPDGNPGQQTMKYFDRGQDEEIRYDDPYGLPAPLGEKGTRTGVPPQPVDLF